MHSGFFKTTVDVHQSDHSAETRVENNPGRQMVHRRSIIQIRADRGRGSRSRGRFGQGTLLRAGLRELDRSGRSLAAAETPCGQSPWRHT